MVVMHGAVDHEVIGRQKLHAVASRQHHPRVAIPGNLGVLDTAAMSSGDVDAHHAVVRDCAADENDVVAAVDLNADATAVPEWMPWGPVGARGDGYLANECEAGVRVRMCRG